MSSFDIEYKKLNARQREAVNNLDGPMLVIAGPGTGKTQLLGARVAQILRKTDALPQNILCLTFTENGAGNMRERLMELIGQDARNVAISTYHAFGGYLINQYPEFLGDARLLNPVDELGIYQIISGIVDKLSYLSPLKRGSHYIGDLISAISEVKRALLSPEELSRIAAANTRFLEEGSRAARDVFAGFTRMPAKPEQAAKYFTGLLKEINSAIPAKTAPIGKITPLATLCQSSLQQAIDESLDLGKTKPLTDWKNRWLAKDRNNDFILSGMADSMRISALSSVLKQYQDELDRQGLYDFDDMILQAVNSLSQNADLRYTLQEQYQYILLDEFQDTNTAQLRLVELLSDNPVNEGRPNVMAVGDDDQAIFAFQGAQYSNMQDFYNMYEDVKIISLKDNYRSHRDILASAGKVAGQIEERLRIGLSGEPKTLAAANDTLPADASISRCEFVSEITQYGWISSNIKRLIDQGVEPREIAVLAPWHKNLEPLVPYLNSLDIPVRYEKRENIIEAPAVKQLLAMSRLAVAIKDGDSKLADSLWPEVLSFDFWSLPVEKIWKASWEINRSNGDNSSWSEVLLRDPLFRPVALFFLGLAGKVDLESFESLFDLLIGSHDLQTNDIELPRLRSAFRQYYLSMKAAKNQPQRFYETLSHIRVIREKLRERLAAGDKPLTVRDFIEFCDMYSQAGRPLINTNPYYQASNAVNIMTVYKAKGLEFEHVFLPSCNDNVWGGSARGNPSKISLPRNLAPIRHNLTTDDERIRIFYVALTRAKIGLHITSFTHNYAGRNIRRLAYLGETEQPGGSFNSIIFGSKLKPVTEESSELPPLESLELDWRARHFDSLSSTRLKSLLRDHLSGLHLSPTYLNSFLDIKYGGPESFFFSKILRFPGAPSASAQYGTAMHETLEWIQQSIDRTGKMPGLNKILSEYSFAVKRKRMMEYQENLQIERGSDSLRHYISQRKTIFKRGDLSEYSFRKEEIIVGGVRINGDIDRLEVDNKKKEIVVVDYKTGQSFASWTGDIKLHQYRRQLYFYKLLIENSHAFKEFKVRSGRLEFLEPDKDGKINALELEFKEGEMTRLRGLLRAVWAHALNLNFPAIDMYEQTLKGILKFEDYLIEEAEAIKPGQSSAPKFLDAAG